MTESWDTIQEKLPREGSELCFEEQVRFRQEKKGASGGGNSMSQDMEVCAASGGDAGSSPTTKA